MRVAPAGELDLATAPLVDDSVHALRASGWRQIVLDLRDVTFMDSTGLRLALGWDLEARRDSLTFSLVAGPPAVQRVFELSGVLDQLTFVAADSRE